MEGWISLYRKFTEWEWYKNSVVKDLFLHLLLLANHKDNKWQGIEIKKGQHLTSIRALSQELGFSEQQIRTAINKLKSTHEITTKTTNKYTLVTIEKYEFYQAVVKESNKQTNEQDNKRITNEQQTNNKQITTNNNDNNENTEKNDNNISLVIQYYEDNINLITETSYSVLEDYLQVMEYRLVIEAIKIAKEKNARNINYIRSILNNWKKSGYTCLEDLNKDKNSNKKKRASDIIENFEKEIENGD